MTLSQLFYLALLFSKPLCMILIKLVADKCKDHREAGVRQQDVPPIKLHLHRQVTT